MTRLLRAAFVAACLFVAPLVAHADLAPDHPLSHDAIVDCCTVVAADVSPAPAPAVVTPGSTVVMAAPTPWQQFWSIVQPFALSLFSLVASIGIGFLSALIYKHTGIMIDAKAQADIHSAAMTGANIAVSRLGATVAANPALRSQMLDIALTWFNRSVPWAISRLGVTPQIATQLVESKLPAAVARYAQPVTAPALK